MGEPFPLQNTFHRSSRLYRLNGPKAARAAKQRCAQRSVGAIVFRNREFQGN